MLTRCVPIVGLVAALLGGCATCRPAAEPDLVAVADGSGEASYEAVRAALVPCGITPHALGSVRFGIWVEARDAARARALLQPVCADPELDLVLVR